MTRAALALALLAGCGPYAGPAAGQGWRWRTEPTVGPSTPALAPLVAQAVDAWGYGRVVPSCVGADVCVVLGQRSRAGRAGTHCVAEVALSPAVVAQPPPGMRRVVEHEIGHCYGLPHSADPASVMYAIPRVGVTPADRAALGAPP